MSNEVIVYEKCVIIGFGFVGYMVVVYVLWVNL